MVKKGEKRRESKRIEKTLVLSSNSLCILSSLLPFERPPLWAFKSDHFVEKQWLPCCLPSSLLTPPSFPHSPVSFPPILFFFRIISAISANPLYRTYAAGSYAGSIYVYDERIGGEDSQVNFDLAAFRNKQELIIEGNKVNSAMSRKRGRVAVKADILGGEEGLMAAAEAAKARWYAKNVTAGVTQLEWGGDGQALYSSSRRGDGIICWDLRMGRPTRSFRRDGNTNQTLQFAFDPTEQLLLAGSKDCKLNIFRVADGTLLGEVGEADGINDAVNGVGVSFNGDGQKGNFAVATGQRHYGAGLTDDDDDDAPKGGQLLLYEYNFK